MKKVIPTILAAIMLLCAACSTQAPAQIEGVMWEYDDMSAIMLSATEEELEDLLWSFDVESPSELKNAMKNDPYFSSTFSNMWFVLNEDGTVEYARNGGPETYYWTFEEGSSKVGYIAQTEEFLSDEENRLKFTVSEKGDELQLESREPYDGDHTYTAVYILKPGEQ